MLCFNIRIYNMRSKSICIDNALIDIFCVCQGPRTVLSALGLLCFTSAKQLCTVSVGASLVAQR